MSSDKLKLCYCSIYVAYGISEPEPNLNEVLLKDTYTTVEILGINSLNEKLKRIFPQTNPEKNNKTQINGLLIHSNSNAILYIESHIPIEDIAQYIDKSSDISHAEQTPLKNYSEDAFKVTSSALTFARGSQLSKSFDQIHTCYLIIDNNNKVREKLSLSSVSSGSGPMTRITSSEIESTKKLVEVFNDKELERILSLYADSLTPYIRGHFFSFVAAWTALEIFIVKQFKNLQSKISIQIGEEQAHELFASKIFDVMNGKYNLLDKFIYVCSYYNKNDLDDDISNFKNLKKIRDSFFHSMTGEIEELPLKGTQELFIKYIHFFLKENIEDLNIQHDN